MYQFQHGNHSRRDTTVAIHSLQILLIGLLLAGSPLVLGGADDPGSTGDPALEVEQPSGLEGARHLLTRSCFGATASQLKQFSLLTREQAVDKLIATLDTEPVTPLPAWATYLPAQIQEQRGKTDKSKKAFQKASRRWRGELRTWWTRELISTPSPLTERLVLLWHGHFTSEINKVRSAQAMYRQNQMFRALGSGDFRKLLHQVAVDPAMSIYLDTRRSTRNKPNENFARELLELYALGEGNYSEQDIKEAARAFTGYRIDRKNGRVHKVKRQHDAGNKTVLGVEGKLDAAAVVDAVLEQPACARWISRRFWIEFVSPTPDDQVVSRWAAQLKEQHWSLENLLQIVLLSDSFWNPEHRGALVKSPVDLVIGTIRSFQLEEVPAAQVMRTIDRLGQELFNPPNVAGWPGGEEWIDATTLLGRRRFLSAELMNLSMLSLMAPPGKSVGKEEKPTSPIDPEMDPGMDPEMDPEMTPQAAEKMIVSREMPRRIKARERRRMMPKVTGKYSALWMQLGTDASDRKELVTRWLLPFEPVGEIRNRKTALSQFSDYLLDPTYQLK